MTLILTVTTNQSSIHVSDRRVVAVAPGRAPVIHSPLENKTIIFVCNDAVGTMGFTGIAYVGKQPTDQWIAQVLTDAKPDGPHEFAVSLGRNGLAGRKLGAIIHRLCNGLAQLRSTNGGYGLSILITGFRVRRKRCFPFGVEISWNGGAAKIAGSMRLPSLRLSSAMFGQIGDGWPTELAMEKLIGHVETNGAGGDEAVRLAAIKTVRERANETHSVGHDLMTVIVPNPRLSKEVVWQFEKKSEHHAAILSSRGLQSFTALYSPWILTPNAIFAPSISTGPMTTGSGNYSFRSANVNELANLDGIAFALSHQDRRMPPGVSSAKKAQKPNTGG